ncbi:MAG: ABC transporter permease [Candidatus Acetothermia bacterium]|jgi:ABC-2 type transport system permease protein|nr:ABC transporter permease [Candidatus Acetothermia bacterium]
MRRLWTFLAVLMRFLIEHKRYPFNTLSALATLYIVFLLLFAGARYAQGMGVDLFGEGLESLVVGYLVWTFAIIAYSDLSWEMMREAQQGTLEQLYMCPVGFRFVSASWIVASFLVSLLWVAVLLGLMTLTTGRLLRLPLGTVLPLLLLTVAPVYGIGFVMAGLALVYKRIQAFFQVLQFVFVALVALPADAPWGKALPLALGTRLLGRVVVDGETLTTLPLGDLLALVGTAVFYLAVGVAVFRVFEGVAKDRGLLAHY